MTVEFVLIVVSIQNMPNKCQTCWNYGKSIMYCIFKCEGMDKTEVKINETKICETCKYENKEPNEQPCDICFKASKWKSKKEGCEFCRGEIKILADDELEFARQKTFVIRMEGYDFIVSDMNSNDKLYSTFEYCPLCGDKL